MENYDWTSFTKKIAVKNSVSEIYDAWTVPQEIEKWFLSKASFQNADGDAVFKSENVNEGDVYEWMWFLYDVKERGKIIEANGVDLLKFTFAGECIVEVKLTESDEYVIVELTQSNIPTDDKSKRGIRLGCDSGWSFFLVNLKSVYEGGIDLRNKDEELKGMLNN
ncbi:MAG: SRPBCC family protein [Flavobacteriales bacterium]